MGMPEVWNDTDIRRQVIKSLKTLQSKYKLINVKFFYSKDAWIEMLDVQEESFAVPSSLIKATSDKKLSMRLKFILMIKAFLNAEGEDIGSISANELAERFHVNRRTINKALQDLQKYEDRVE